MLFHGPVVRRVGEVDRQLLDETLNRVERISSGQWRTRSKLNIGTEVLKIIAPLPNVDLLEPVVQASLLDAVTPLIDAIPKSASEMVCYADVSSLKAGTKLNLHFDNVWLHVLSRRIHIPLKTNLKTRMGFLTARDQVEVVHFECGGIYEVNNTHPHSARNGGDTDRWHLLVDLIDRDAMAFIAKTWMYPVVAPSLNRVWGDVSYNAMEKALK